MAASRLGVLAAAAARRRDGGGELPRAERGVRPAGAVAARHRTRHGGERRSNILTFIKLTAHPQLGWLTHI